MCGLHPARKGGASILPGKGLAKAHAHAKISVWFPITGKTRRQTSYYHTWCPSPVRCKEVRARVCTNLAPALLRTLEFPQRRRAPMARFVACDTCVSPMVFTIEPRAQRYTYIVNAVCRFQFFVPRVYSLQRTGDVSTFGISSPWFSTGCTACARVPPKTTSHLDAMAFNLRANGLQPTFPILLRNFFHVGSRVA